MKLLARLIGTCVGAALIVACGSTATAEEASVVGAADQAVESSVTEPPTTASEDPATESVAAESSTTSEDPQEVPDQLADWELGLPSDVPAGLVRLPAAGGVSFTMEQERMIFQHDGFFAIPDPESPEGTSAVVGIKIHQFVNDEAKITSGADVLDVLTEAAFLEIEPLDEGIEIDGTSFQGFRIESSIAAGTVPPGRLFSAAEPGGPNQLYWFPNPFNVHYIGDSADGGALVFGYEGPDEDRLQFNQAVFEEILPSLSLSSGLDG